MESQVDPLDEAVVKTGDDALMAKRAAVAAGYYDDPFLEPLSTHGHGLPPVTSCASPRRLPPLSEGSTFQPQQQPPPESSTGQRNTPRNVLPPTSPRMGSHRPGLPGTRSPRSSRHQQPIIKRGTHARVCCIDRVITAFTSLQHPRKQRQVVVLGAGKDTSYFRHRAGPSISGEAFRTENDVQWFEVDYDPVIHSKAKIIHASPVLSSQGDIKRTGKNSYLLSNSGSSSTCSLLGHDLRLAPQELMDKMLLCNFDPEKVTLFVFECIQLYLPEETSRSLLQFLSQSCANACLVLYDPILGSDPFGKVMEQNLIGAGVARRESSLLHTRTLQDQLDKLVTCGFDHAVGCDMWSAYETVVTPDQRRRANQAEFLDELEEWILIMQHYCLVVCCKTNNEFGLAWTNVGPSSPIGFVSNRCQQSRQGR